MNVEPAFTLGIEEEYLLVDRDTRDLVSEVPPELIDECARVLGDHVTPEFLQAQIEIGTAVCNDLPSARAELATSRRCVAEIAAKYGWAPIAASTHPFAEWHDQKQTAKERYDALADDMQVVARRLLICGMHVHIGIDDDEMRIDLLNQVPYFLPHILALSTSSPFWGGEDTGLMSYRLSVFDELPRTGLPESFASHAEYRRMVETMVNVGLVEDATKIWWDIRPSDRFPTVEMRITDVCTRLDDAIAIAALFRCVCRLLWRLRRDNQRWRVYPKFLISENRWRAQRYGIDAGLVDFAKNAIVHYADLLEELLDLVAPDAAEFGCEAEIAHARTILSQGTSAHRQRQVYETAKGGGASEQEALARVVDHLIGETVSGLD